VSQANFPYTKVVIVGLGLIGGSIAKALRRRFLELEIVGVDSDKATLEAALYERVISKASLTLPKEIEQGSLVLLAMGFGQILEALPTMSGVLPKGAWFTEVSGVKRRIVARVEELGGVLTESYVGSHPMAGREVHGFHSSLPNLFEGYPVFLTGCSKSLKEGYERLTLFWHSLGGLVRRLEPIAHDRIVAWISHLPHILSFVLKRTLYEDWPSFQEPSGFKGSGIQGMLRIAESDPNVWSELMVENRDFDLEALEAFFIKAQEFKGSLIGGHPKELLRALAPGLLKDEIA
jgi:prephenate dehydrogenase